jgi:hypothetical protein
MSLILFIWYSNDTNYGAAVLSGYAVLWRNSPTGPGPPHYRGFTTIVSRTPLDERSARHRDIYLTTHDYCNRQTSVPPAGFEPRYPSKRAAADWRLRRRGHWDRSVPALPISNSEPPHWRLVPCSVSFMFKIQNGSEILWEVFVLKFILTEVTLKANNSLHVWYDAV